MTSLKILITLSGQSRSEKRWSSLRVFHFMKNYEELVIDASIDEHLTLADMGTYLVCIGKAIQGNCYGANFERSEFQRMSNCLMNLQAYGYVEQEPLNKEIFPTFFVKILR